MTIKTTTSRETSTIKRPLKDPSINKNKYLRPIGESSRRALRDETKTAAWETIN